MCNLHAENKDGNRNVNPNRHSVVGKPSLPSALPVPML